jgi:hypothetical protein
MRAEDRNGGIFLEHAGMCVLRRAPSPLGFASKDSPLKLLRRFFWFFDDKSGFWFTSL